MAIGLCRSLLTWRLVAVVVLLREGGDDCPDGFLDLVQAESN